MHKELRLQVRDPECTRCKLHQAAEDVCVVGDGPKKPSVMVVGKMPNSSSYQKALDADLREAGIDPTNVMFTQALKCRPSFEDDVRDNKTDLKACRPYLEAEIALIKPRWVLTLGNEALFAATGHSGVMTYRGRVLDRVIDGHEFRVVPTISPAAVRRQPGQRTTYISDLRFFAAQVEGKAASVGKPKIAVIRDVKALRTIVKLMRRATHLSFDVETYSTPVGDEFAEDAMILTLAGTMRLNDDRVMCWALPLGHPQSPFRHVWKKALAELAGVMPNVPRLIAHNGKYDCRWLKQFGVDITMGSKDFDTILAAHLLDENRQKGLKPQATSRFGVEQWAVDKKALIDTPLNEVLRYNALDTWYTWHLYLELREELQDQSRLLRIFKKLLMPANEILIDVERRGVWMDREKTASAFHIAQQERARIEDALAEFLPDADPIAAQHEDFNWPTNSKGKPVGINWNPSNFLRWFLFEHLQFPVLKRGKEKDDGREGDPSVAEDVMLELQANFPHPVIDLLLERVKWQKYCSAFLGNYLELLDDEDRIHTTFKLFGTVTGRLSSGKAEAEKISGRANRKGVNLQQVPRDPFVRGLFGAAPGYTFVEADFSQVELRVAAFLSRDSTMMHLYRTGQDIHRATAAWVLGVPLDKVTSEDRKKAKAVNFGFVYGMGWRKFIYTAFTKYQVNFTEQEAQDIRRAFFEQFPGLLRWHARMRRLVNQFARVQSPIGRVRHLPDIESGEYMVRAEAERQAINSPVQSFASDMTLLSMLEIGQAFEDQRVEGHFISTVHDALLFEVKNKHLAKALPIIKSTMENLPLKRKFGVDLDIPIVADLKVGKYWGEAKELTEEEVHDYRP